MIINNIARYQTTDFKARNPKDKPPVSVVSTATPQDSYELSEPRERKAVREDLISSVRKKINNGFYHSKDVLEQLSDSFAKVLNQTL